LQSSIVALPGGEQRAGRPRSQAPA